MVMQHGDLEMLSRRLDDLAREKEKFRNLVEGSIQGLLIHRDWRPVFVNRRFAEMLGYEDPAEVLALGSIDPMLAPAERERLHRYAQARLQNETPPSHYEYEGVCKNGRTVWLEIEVRKVDWEGSPALQVAAVDITERRRAQQRDQASMSLLRTVFDALPHRIAVKDRDGRFLMVNRAAAENHGMAVEDIVGRTTAELPTRTLAEREAMVREDRQIVDGVVPRIDVEKTLTETDGRQSDVHTIKVPLHDEQGRIAGSVAIVNDITPRKMAERELRQSKALLDAILAHIPSALSVVDRELNMLAFNDRLLETLDFPKEARSWRTFEDFTRYNAERGEYGPGDVEAQVQERMALARQFVPHHFERERPDGRVLDIRGNPLSDGGFITIYRDVTESRQAAEALRKSEQRFRDLVEAASDWFWEMDENYQFTYVSSRFFEATGLREEAFVGHANWMDRLVLVSDEAWRQHVQGLEAHEAFRHFRFRTLCSDGQLHTFETTGKPVFDAQGNFRGYRGTGTDITGEIEAEQRAGAAHARLIDAIASISEGFCLFDRNDQLILCNDQFRGLYPAIDHILEPGVSFAHIIQESVRLGVIPEAHGREEAWLRERMADHRNPGGTHEREVSDGRWFTVRERPTKEGGIVAIWSEITQRKEAEEALRDSEERFRNLIEGSLQGMVVLTPDLVPRFANQAYADIFGCGSPEEVLATGDVLTLIAPEEHERLRGYARARMAGEPAPTVYEFQGVRRDGRRIWVYSSSRPVRWYGEPAIQATVFDITDRRAAEEALRISEASLVAGQRLAHLGSWSWDRNAKRTHWSDELYRIIGCEPQSFAGSFDAIQPFIHPDDREHFAASLRAALRGTALYDFEHRIVRADGTHRVVHELADVVRNEQGEVAQVVGSMHDITERREAELALRESELRIRTLVSNVAVVLISLSLDGTITFCEGKGLEPLGIKPHQVIGRSIYEVISGQPGLENDFRRALTGQNVVSVRRQGHVVLENRFTPVRDGGGRLNGIICVAIDISEHKRIEEELRKSEAYFRALINNTLELVAIVDRDGRVKFTSPSVDGMLGYAPGELLGRIVFDLVHPEDLTGVRSAFARVLRSNEPGSGVAYRVRHKDGSWRHLEFTGTNLTDVAVIDGLVIYCRDVTEQHRIAEELAAERANLERTVVQRTQELEASLRDLEVANAQLRKADQARSRFLSSLSHELRTPLNSILGFSDLMRGQYFGPLNEKQVGYVQQIEYSGKHLLSLINDLLDLARIDAGGMTVEATVIPTEELLQSTVAMISTQFAEKRIMLETQVAPHTRDLLADQRRGKQVLLNLLSNAVKYTPEGGSVRVHARDEGENYVRVEVQDNGIGIDPSETERIFAEFHQADRVRDGQFGGTGIGLALSKRLVEIQGGHIGVESTPGEGTTFWFTLPSGGGGSEGGDKADEERRRGRLALRGRRILVAEDNDLNLSVLLDMLSLQEHEVTVARNGQEALELARSTSPELILIDIRMPVMDGLEATRRLRAMSEFANVPIVALTASTGADAEQEQLRAGITEHLAKPFRAEALFDVLQRHLGGGNKPL